MLFAYFIYYPAYKLTCIYVQNHWILCLSYYRTSHIRSFPCMLIDLSSLKRTLTPHRVSPYRVCSISTNFPLDLPQPKRTVPQVINTLLDLQLKPQTAKINRVQSGCRAVCARVFECVWVCVFSPLYSLHSWLDLFIFNELRQRQQQQLMEKNANRRTKPNPTDRWQTSQSYKVSQSARGAFLTLCRTRWWWPLSRSRADQLTGPQSQLEMNNQLDSKCSCSLTLSRARVCSLYPPNPLQCYPEDATNYSWT